MTTDRCLSLDRVAPTVRPDGPSAGTQRWRELLFAHWSVPLDRVRPLVPSELELDPWDGRAWIGLVPFRMEAVRTSFMPRALGMTFLELNLRTYVHHRGRPGVWFFSLEASSWLAVRAARATWSLPYWHASMHTERDDDRVVFTSTRRRDGARFAADYAIGARLGPSAPGTFEHFLLERYLLFAHRGGAILEGQVHHPAYVAHEVRIASLEDGLMRAASLPEAAGAPEIAHWSPGVEVEVFGPRRHAR